MEGVILNFHIWIGPLCLPQKQNERIIFSCLSDIRVLGSFAQHPKIHPFYSPTNPLDNTFYLKPLFDQAQRKHPIDLLIWWGIQDGVPLDLHQINLPKAWVISDWHNHWPIVDFSRHFNWIFCDQKLKEVLKPKVSSSTKVIYRSNYAFVPQLIPPTAPERDIDVLFVGNTLAQKYRIRNQYLLRLAQMQSIKTHIAHGVSEPEYLNLLTRSKIAFNHALRQEMNLRAYEATACGAALMMPIENKEVNFFLRPDQEYIPYNAKNFETKIEYYLKHDNERIVMAQRAKQTLSQEHYEHKFKALIDYLHTQIPLHNSPLRPANTILSGLLLGFTSDRISWKKHTPFYLKSHLSNVPTSQDWKPLNALLVTQAEQYPQATSIHELHHTQTEVFHFLKTHPDLLQAQPAIQTLLYYNLAWSYFYQQDNTNCAQILKHIQSHKMDQLPSLLSKHFFILPIHYLGFQLLYQETAYSNEALLTKVLKAGVFFLQGKVLHAQGQLQQAIHAFEHSLQQCPLIIEAYFELAALFTNTGQALKAEQCLTYGLSEGVFYPKMWKAYLSLIQQRPLSDAEKERLQYLTETLSRLPLFKT